MRKLLFYQLLVGIEQEKAIWLIELFCNNKKLILFKKRVLMLDQQLMLVLKEFGCGHNY